MNENDTMAIVSGINSLSKSISDYKAAQDAGDLGLQSIRETNEANLAIARETNQANLDLYKMQADNAWNLQKEAERYNSPQVKVEQLREAGLNPALNYGNPATVGMVNLPSASPAVGATMQSAPYDAYRDISARPFADMVNDMLASMQGVEKLKAQQLDNTTKDAYNRAQITEMIARIDNLIDSGKTSEKQRSLLVQQREALRLANRLFEDTYNDKIDQSELQSKFMDLTNRSIDSQIANDAARVAIQKFEAETNRRLSNAQINSINTMANLAINADWRSSQSHVMDMNLKQLDGVLKHLNISDAEKQNIFNEIMRQSEEVHTELKDASLLNKMAERAFGLGFRDLGTAIRTLISK